MKPGRLDLRVVLVKGAMPSRSRLDLAGLRRVAGRARSGLRGRIDVVLTGDDELRRLNRAFRGMNAPTDVLSFDMGDGAPDGLAGEVYISLAYARRRASKRRRSLQKEVLHLTIHGILHIAGHGHETDEAWRAMERETRKYLKA